jgi:hypothetical protein
MAKTYLDLLLETRQHIGASSDQSLSQSTLNDAFRFFWDVEPWRETLTDMPAFYLVPGWSFYTAPYIDVPTTFKDLFSAQLVQVSSDGSLTERPLEVYGNMKPGNLTAQVSAMGYSFEFAGFVLDALPNKTLGLEYIRPKMKLTYPVDLTAANAASTDFPFERFEGLFKVILAWFIRGRPEAESNRVGRAIAEARIGETPGRQSAAQSAEGLFSSLGDC